MLSRARVLRGDATPAGHPLWQGLRSRALGGLKFRRQVPSGPYIANFYGASAKVVVEVDGISHIESRTDAVRDAWIAEHRIRVVRVANRDMLAKLEGTLIAIGESAGRPASPNPLPQREGGSSSQHTVIHLHV